MNNFKLVLKQQLQHDVPFTNELKNKMNQKLNEKKDKRGNLRTLIFAFGLIVTIALCVIAFWKISPSTPSDYLMNASSIPSEAEELLQLLQQREPTLPIIEEIKDHQMIIEASNVQLTGRLLYFQDVPLIMESSTAIHRGDYVVIEQNNEQIIRQVLALSNETYTYKDGNLQVNGKQVLLPSMVAINHTKIQNIIGSEYYFNFRTSYMFDVMNKQLEKDMLLIKAVSDDRMIEEISEASIQGKVVGVYKVEPTFMVQGEDAKTFEAFRKSKDTTLLKDVNPVVILRMFNTALLEKDYATMYEMQSNYVWAFDVSLADYMESFIYDRFSTEEMRVIYGAMYNDLDNATVTYNNAKTEANVTFGPSNRMITLILNKEGFWEFKLG